jgi:phage baseplate assembly protein W
MNGDNQPRGFSFPFRIDPVGGGVGVTGGPDKLRENIKHLLLTRIGERPMLRDYGGGVTQLLHENVNDGLIAVAKHQIGRAIVRFEPRVLLQEVSVIPRNGELFLRVIYLQADQPGLQSLAMPLGS